MGVFDNLGYIAEASYFPCINPDPWLIIKAGGSSVLPVLVSAVSFGCNDIVKMRAGVSPWHTRGMRALIDWQKLPDDPYNHKGLLKYTVPLEKALFFFFVVDLTTEFVARWQSNIFKLGACDNKADDCSWSGSNPSWTAPHPGAQMLVTYGTDSISGNCYGRPSNGFFVPDGYYWSAYFSLKVEPIIPGQPTGTVTTWLESHDADHYKTIENKDDPSWFGNSVHASYMHSGQTKRRGGRTWYFMASCTEVAMATSGSAAISISNTPLYNKGIIPVNCFGAPAPSHRPPDTNFNPIPLKT